MKCKICGHDFVPEKGQNPAWWAVTWCVRDSGLLCPPCHKAAEELNAVSSEELSLGLCPFGSDIAVRSTNITREDWKRIRESETYQTWVKQNHPEWT